MENIENSWENPLNIFKKGNRHITKEDKGMANKHKKGSHIYHWYAN